MGPPRITERFGLDPAKLEPLTGGNRAAIFRQGDVVIRFEAVSPPSLHWEHELVRFLAQRVPEVPVPLDLEDNVSVWPFVPGHAPRRNYEPHAVAAAELLGRLHQAAAEWRGPQRPGAQDTPGEGPRAPIHGDFWRANMLMVRGTIVGLVDWEESCVDLLEYELANAVWEFCKSKRTHDFDRRLAAAMVEAYGAECAPDELIPMILIRRRRELGASDESYRRHTQRAIENLSRERPWTVPGTDKSVTNCPLPLRRRPVSRHARREGAGCPVGAWHRRTAAKGAA